MGASAVGVTTSARQLGDGTVGVITSATVPPKNRRSASKRNMRPFLFAQPVFRWPPEPSKWCPEGASSSAAEPVGRPVQLVAKGSVQRHEQQNGRQPVTPPHPPARSSSGRQPVPPWRSSTVPVGKARPPPVPPQRPAAGASAAVAPAAEAAEAAVAAPEPAAFAPVPARKAKQPSCPPPSKVLRRAEATASSAAVVATTEPVERSKEPAQRPKQERARSTGSAHHPNLTAAERARNAAQRPEPERSHAEEPAASRSSANKLSVGRTYRPSTEGSCGLELALRRLMNTLLTKSKRERCRETIIKFCLQELGATREQQ